MYEASLAGFSGGLFYDKHIVHYLDLRAGVMYSPKESYLKKENSYSSIYQKTFVKYIDIPVRIKANAGPFYALGGIYGAYALKPYSTYHATGIPGGFIVSDDFTNLRHIDFGLKGCRSFNTSGIRVRFPVAKTSWLTPKVVFPD